jgi:hypothetical protein
MKQSELRQIIKEEIQSVLNEESSNYMFFQNLKTIKMAVDKLLAMDKNMVDSVLLNGHDWAADHIATSKDDVEEVYSFFATKRFELDEKAEFSKKYDDNPLLKGKQGKLPDKLQQSIITKKSK